MGSPQKLPTYRSVELLSPLTRTQNTIPTVAIIGIGGLGGHRLADYYHRLGINVIGFDMRKSPLTEELEEKGIKIEYRNPEERLSVDALICSFALPEKIRTIIQEKNAHLTCSEIGALLSQLGKMQMNGELSKTEANAIKKAKIAPLLDIDYSKATFIGVTGTDGKTTTCLLLHHILTKLGYKVGVVSTVVNKIGNRPFEADNHVTTPSAEILERMIKKMLKAHCTHIIIETSSQGLASERMVGVKFDAVTITNITSDHLDYHKTRENYIHSKKTIVTEHLKPNGVAVLNKDDSSYYDLAENTANVLTYSLNQQADLQANDYVFKRRVRTFTLFSQCSSTPSTIRTKLPGLYNVSNILGTIGLLCSIGIDTTANVIRAIESFAGAEGRMHILRKAPFTVIIDYAHTINGLKEALMTARSFLRTKDSRLIAVIALPGERDCSKRIPMGAIAKEFADATIIAPASPRFDSQNNINKALADGWRQHEENNNDKKLYQFDMADDDCPTKIRTTAIEKAIQLARPGDVIISTDVGHETDLLYKGKSIPWSEENAFREALRKYLR